MITQPELDNFTRANGAIGGNWTNDLLDQGGGAGLEIDANRAAPATGSFDTAWYNTLFGADQEAWAVVETLPAATTGLIQLFLRVADPGDNDNLTCYEVTFWNFPALAGVILIRRYVDGVVTTLAQVNGVTFEDGNTLGAVVRGTSIAAYVRVGAGAYDPVAEVDDAEVAGGGYIGLGINGSAGRVRSFGGGTWTPPGPVLYMTKQHRELVGSPVHQGEDERVFYIIDTSAFGAGADGCVLTVKDKSAAEDDEEVTDDVNEFAFSFPTTTRVILPRIFGLTRRRRYRVEVLMLINDQWVEPHFTIIAEF